VALVLGQDKDVLFNAEIDLCPWGLELIRSIGLQKFNLEF